MSIKTLITTAALIAGTFAFGNRASAQIASYGGGSTSLYGPYSSWSYYSSPAYFSTPYMSGSYSVPFTYSMPFTYGTYYSTPYTYGGYYSAPAYYGSYYEPYYGSGLIIGAGQRRWWWR